MSSYHSRTRRAFLRNISSLAPALAATRIAWGEAAEGFRPLFDGKTLQGWHAVPRLPIPKFPSNEQVPPDKLKERVLARAEENPALRKLAAHTGRWIVN
jgi:hypothetical protein